MGDICHYVLIEAQNGKRKMSKHLENFLTNHTLQDIKTEVIGELFQDGNDECSYFYGNGELIVCPADCDLDETVYVIDTYGDEDILVEF